MSEVIFNTQVPQEPDFIGWSSRFKDRQQQVQLELERVDFTFLSPPLINLMADLHVGHPTTHYDRIEDEVQAIVDTPNSFVVLVGDLIDGMHWNPGQFEQQEQVPEQISYVHALIDYLTDHSKLLLSIMGDHDGWLKKIGYDLNSYVRRKGAHATTGPTKIGMNVGEQDYRLGGAHQLPGHSIYNKVHPQTRATKFGPFSGGVDVVFSGHNHQKGYGEAYKQEWDGTRKVSYIALGPYKPTDGWLKKKGYAPQQVEELFGSSVHLAKGRKWVVYDSDILQANRRHKL